MTPGSATYGDYVEDLHHATFNANLDFTSGYAADFIGFDVAALPPLTWRPATPRTQTKSASVQLTSAGAKNGRAMTAVLTSIKRR